MRVIDLQTELNALGIKFEPIGYVKAPAYPYGIYVDEIAVTQPDTSTGARISTHDVTIELYHADYNALNTNAKKVDGWINSIPLNYRKCTSYIIDEDHYCVSFIFSYKNKERDDLL